MHCRGSFRQSVEDAPGALSAAIDAACAACDVLLLTGGVSAGDFDYVPRCLRERGAEILFHGVAVKPGKPTLFARSGSTWIFGLPGNPVSTFVICGILLRPFLYRRMGITWQPPSHQAVLAETIARREADRTELIPVRVREGAATPVEYHGSSDLNGLGAADGLLRVPRGTFEVPQGTAVAVRPYSRASWKVWQRLIPWIGTSAVTRRASPLSSSCGAWACPRSSNRRSCSSFSIAWAPPASSSVSSPPSPRPAARSPRCSPIPSPRDGSARGPWSSSSTWGRPFPSSFSG